LLFRYHLLRCEARNSMTTRRRADSKTPVPDDTDPLAALDEAVRALREAAAELTTPAEPPQPEPAPRAAPTRTSTDRAALIRQALAVREARQDALAELNNEQRRRLNQLARVVFGGPGQRDDPD